MSEEKKDQLGQDTPKQSEPKTKKDQELSPQELEKAAGGLSTYDQAHTLGSSVEKKVVDTGKSIISNI